MVHVKRQATKKKNAMADFLTYIGWRRIQVFRMYGTSPCRPLYLSNKDEGRAMPADTSREVHDLCH